MAQTPTCGSLLPPAPLVVVPLRSIGDIFPRLPAHLRPRSAKIARRGQIMLGGRSGCAPARPFSCIDFGRATAVLRVSLLGARLLFNFISRFSLSSDVEASAQNHLAALPERPLCRAVPRKPMPVREPILASPSDELRSSWLRRPRFRRPS